MTRTVLDIDAVGKNFGRLTAVDDVSLSIRENEFFALLGPSGCGKTTLLRMLAGFETPTEGRILLDGRDIARTPPNKRPVNLMFQSYALFPHMSVRANVSYGLEMERLPKAEIRSRVDAILATTELVPFADRKPEQLSGGQRQRVALARALVKRPKLLLLDEPLAALDRKLREGTRFEMVRLQEQLGLTFVVVTHDQEEAMSMAGRLAVMKDGAIVQIGTPHEIYERPATRFVADFIGIANILQTGPRQWLALRPEKIVLAGNRPATAHAATGKVVDIAYEGDRSLFRVAIENGPVMLVSTMNVARNREGAWRRGDT